MQSDLTVALIKYNKRTWCKSALLGFFIGLAVIVPGISGSTVAVIFKLYDGLLYAFGNLFKRFKACFFFLLPIGIGAVFGLLLGFFTVKKLLGILPFAVTGLFAGLMCGAFPSVKDELKGAEMTAKRVLLLALGVLIPIAVGMISVLAGAGEGGEGLFSKVTAGQVLAALPIGFAVGVTQVVPGLSATAVLMSLGWFKGLMNGVSPAFWYANPEILLVYAGLAVGSYWGFLPFPGC